MLSHRALFIGALLVGASSDVHADDWGTVAIVSSTLGNNTNRLCVGAPDATRAGDLGCPTYAPSVTTAGDVSITGNVSANHFIGDGSQLTGIDAGNVDGLGPADRISSSTSNAMVRTFDGGTVSFTTGGVAGTSYLNTAGHWIGPGISLTTAHGISSTNGYFTGRVGIGTSTPNSLLHLHQESPNYVNLQFSNQDSADGVRVGITSSEAAVLIAGVSTTGLVLGTNSIPRFVMDNNGRVKLGGTLWSVAPLATFDVIGTISATDAIQVGTSSLTCSTGLAGAIRYNGGDLQLCDGNSWGSLADAAGAASAVSPTGAIQFSADGSGAFGGDAANLYWDNGNKRLGVGTSGVLPQSRLHVGGNGAFVSEERLFEMRYGDSGGTGRGLFFLGPTVDDAAAPFHISTNNSVNFRIDNVPALTVAANAAVGISTTQPSRTLTVNGIGWLSALELEHVTGAASPISVSVDSGVESDPQVGALISGKWCTSDGSVVNCTSDEPTGGAGDNLGNHSASQPLVLNGNLISGDGDSEGLTVQSDGSVSLTSIIRVAGSGSEGCTAADIGAIRFNPVTETFQACRP